MRPALVLPIIVTAFGLFTAACSASNSEPGPPVDGAIANGKEGAATGGGRGTPACKLQLAGAETAEAACDAGALFDTEDNSTSVFIVTREDSPAPAGAFRIKMRGEPVMGVVSYAAALEGTFDWTHDFTTSPNNTPTWSATKTADEPSENRGDFSMNVTSVTMKDQTKSGKIYVLHGTVTGTLPFVDDSGATGIVTATITF